MKSKLTKKEREIIAELHSKSFGKMYHREDKSYMNAFYLYDFAHQLAKIIRKLTK